MNVIDRLKMELGNKEYFTDEQYIQFLIENDFDPNLVGSLLYDKTTMQKQLLFTVLDILEAVCNDVDIMRRVETEFTTTSGAYTYLKERIQSVKDRIASIPNAEEEYSDFTLMYTRK